VLENEQRCRRPSAVAQEEVPVVVKKDDRLAFIEGQRKLYKIKENPSRKQCEIQ